MALNKELHKGILIKILKDIYNDSSLGSILGFKGGTAAFMFYNLPRFSVDLDFDLLDKEKEDYVFERIKEIISSYGEVKKARKKRFNLFFFLSYEKESQNIKIEINREGSESRYEVKSYFGISMKAMNQERHAVHKLVAMYERIGKTNRDIFDTWFLLQNDWPINKEIIENRTNLSFKQFLKKCISLFQKMEERDILSGMGELLENKQKIWAKKNLIKDVLFLLKLRLDNENHSKA